MAEIIATFRSSFILWGDSWRLFPDRIEHDRLFFGCICERTSVPLRLLGTRTKTFFRINSNIMAGVLGVSVFSILTYYSWNMSTILGGYFDMLYGALGLLILWFAEFLYMVLHPEYFIAFPGEVPIYIRFSKRETNIAQAFAHLVAKEISKVLEE